MKRVFQLIGITMVIFCLIFLVRHGMRNVSLLPSIDWDIIVVLSFSLAIVLYCTVVIIGGLIWHYMLVSIGEKKKFKIVMRIFLLSQIGKYIPGNIGQYVGRIALAKRQGLRISPVILTMIMEAGWTVCAGGIISLIALFTIKSEISVLIDKSLQDWKIVAAVVVSLSIPVFAVLVWQWIIRRVSPRFKTDNLRIPSIKVLMVVFSCYALSFVLLGAAMNAIGFGLFHISGTNLLTLTGITTVAWLAGFLTPGAPAGLGVREAVIVALCDPLFGGGPAIGLSVGFRLVSLLGDGILFALVMSTSHFRFTTGNNPAEFSAK